MPILFYAGVLINTLTFGAMGWRRNRLGIPMPAFYKNDFLQLLITLIYYGSFVLILLSPANIWVNIATCLLLQFLINHIVWGIILGVIAGMISRRSKTLSI